MSLDLTRAISGSVVATAEGAPVTLEELARYAQASGDLNPLHTDKAFAAKAGFANVVVHGMLNMARLGRMVTDLVDSTRITYFSVRFEGVLLADEATQMRLQYEGESGGVAVLDMVMTTVDERRIASGVIKVSISDQPVR